MIYQNYMRFLRGVFIVLLLLAACCTVNIDRMNIKGVDKRAQSLYNEYKRLGEQQHVKFTREVPVGFTSSLPRGIVAECFMGPDKRQVLISEEQWDTLTRTERLETIFHELTHCFCERMHDYKGIPYPKTGGNVAFYTDSNVSMFYGEDGCPKSIMFPYVIDRKCTLAHYSDYVKEMFDNCTPW